MTFSRCSVCKQPVGHILTSKRTNEINENGEPVFKKEMMNGGNHNLDSDVVKAALFLATASLGAATTTYAGGGSPDPRR